MALAPEIGVCDDIFDHTERPATTGQVGNDDEHAGRQEAMAQEHAETAEAGMCLQGMPDLLHVALVRQRGIRRVQVPVQRNQVIAV